MGKECDRMISYMAGADCDRINFWPHGVNGVNRVSAAFNNETVPYK